MKYDNKLFILEAKYINEIIKIKLDLKNTKNKLEINTNLVSKVKKG